MIRARASAFAESAAPPPTAKTVSGLFVVVPVGATPMVVPSWSDRSVDSARGNHPLAKLSRDFRDEIEVGVVVQEREAGLLSRSRH